MYLIQFRILILGFIFCFFTTLTAKAQQLITYYSEEGDTIVDKNLAAYYTITEPLERKNNTQQIKGYYSTNEIKFERSMVNCKYIIENKEYFKNNKLKLVETYSLKDSLFKRIRYWGNGTIQRKETYVKDSLIEGFCYNASGAVVPYTPYEVMPEFPGGEEAMYRFINSMIVYPATAMASNTQGRVVVGFIVNAKGEITRPEILHSVSKEIDDESVRVIMAMPKWKPGLQDGLPVRVKYSLPIEFSLSE